MQPFSDTRKSGDTLSSPTPTASTQGSTHVLAALTLSNDGVDGAVGSTQCVVGTPGDSQMVVPGEYLNPEPGKGSPAPQEARMQIWRTGPKSEEMTNSLHEADQKQDCPAGS